jgi:glycosyltransferase involved in cell wall biosynthesis
MTTPSVAWVPAWLDACCWYRMFQPSLHWERSRFVFHPVKTPVADVADADIVVVQRQCTEGNMQAMQQMKNMGLKIIYDLDDDLWSIPATSPAKQQFDPIMHGFGRCIRLCDALTVSTEPLRTAVHTALPETKDKKIFVVPNAVDFDYLHIAPLPKPAGRVTVGWGGSNTHQGDVEIAWSVLPKLLDELSQLYIEFVGMAPPERLHGHPRVRERAFCPVGEYISRFPTWGWDIMIAPLADIRFNNSKSNIRVLEAAAVGAVCLMSDVGSFARFCTLNSDLNWLLCRTPQHWYEKLRELIVNAQLRGVMATRIRRTALEHFEQKQVMSYWKAAFEAVMS